MGGLTKIAAETFAFGGPGAILFQLMLIGVVSWLLAYVCAAVNKGQIADMIRVVSLFLGIGMITAEALKVILAIAKIAGIV
jgi:hypothetical protein